MDVEWCKNPDRGLPAPDVVFYMQLSIEQAMKRGAWRASTHAETVRQCAAGAGGFGEERYEKKEFQERVKAIYEHELRDSSWEARRVGVDCGRCL